jgi:hypothetical protein
MDDEVIASLMVRVSQSASYSFSEIADLCACIESCHPAAIYNFACVACEHRAPRPVLAAILYLDPARALMPSPDTGCYPIHYACQHSQNAETLELLLSLGCPLDVRTPDGMTPLHIAADAGCLENVEFLLSHFAPVNVQDDSGATPLMYAVRRRHCDVVRALVKIGKADVNLAGVDGVSPALWVEAGGDMELALMML